MCLCAAAVLAGWALAIPTLTAITPAWPSMASSTAAGFLFAGATLYLAAGTKRYRLVQTSLASLVVAIGVARVCELVTGLPSGTSQWLFRQPLGGINPPLMVPATALGFVCIGLALLLSNSNRHVGAFESLSSAAGVFGWLGINHYLFGGEALSPHVNMAVHTAALFLAISCGAFCARTDGGLMAVAVSDTVGGIIARRLVPTTLVAPILLRWLRTQGQTAGWYDTHAGWSLFTLANRALFGGLTWAAAARLHRADLRRRLAERQLIDSQRQLRAEAERTGAMIETALDGIIVMDHEGKIVEFNPAAETMFGHRAVEVVGRLLADVIIPPDLREAHSLGLARYLASGEGPVVGGRIEVTGIRTDGTPISLELGVARMPVLGPPLFTGFLRDLTERNRGAEERQRLEAQLRHSQKMDAMGRLAGGVAHDFNNLLTVISGYSQMLRDGHTLERANAVQYADEILRAADRATAVTRQLLAFSRHQVAAPRNIDLNELLRELDKLLSRLIREDIALSLSLSKQAVTVRADPGQLEQVVMNLVINARDAMPEGGKLIISTTALTVDEAYAAAHFGVAPGGYVTLTVTDTGIGMSPEVRAQIFEPFFTTKEAGKGTGLGLSMVYGIVKQSGGSIFVYSEVGQGSTFRILLPATEGQAQSPPAPSQPCCLGGHETILLVEDEPALQRYVRATLERSGYRVITAANGEQALRTLSDGDTPAFDLVISDMIMPEMGGAELAAELAVLQPDVPILHMSGYVEREWAGQASTRFIEKPFTPAALLSTVRAILDAGLDSRKYPG